MLLSLRNYLLQALPTRATSAVPTAARGFRFALCPQLQGVKAHPGLGGHAGYRRLYDHLIAEKR
ncbi:MAG: hypothetical protein HY748_11525 [Elusimicrobia bacterium]|nr:hypothetical protein [Elusimicrobiota bacterium]